MWLMFPKGQERVSVERQTFEIEVKDAEGNCYTRVPNHFVPILTHHLGFHVANPPEDANAPPDLPPVDPLRDGAIADLSRENETLRADATDLRTTIAVAYASVTALTNERDDLKKKLDAAMDKIEVLEEKLADKE